MTLTQNTSQKGKSAAAVFENKINKQDQLIGNQLTQNQMSEIEARIKGFEQSFSENTDRLMKEITDALLNTKSFSQSGSDFYKKLNTICKFIRQGKWTFHQDLTIPIKSQSKREGQILQIKWVELQQDLTHWERMRELGQRDQTPFLPHIEQLVKESREKLQHFEKNHQAELKNYGILKNPGTQAG